MLPSRCWCLSDWVSHNGEWYMCMQARNYFAMASREGLLVLAWS
jgi:hypothetical protein